MRVDLIDYTGKGLDAWYTARLLIWTKRTRVEMSAGSFEELETWPEEQLLQELCFMAATIPSSWEFADFTFLCSNVTRVFTHQLVRSRNMSFAQQTLQTQDARGWKNYVGPTVRNNPRASVVWHETMDAIAKAYGKLIELGVDLEDARGILPLNIENNIVVKGNLRSWCDLLRKRASPRNQGAKPDRPGEWTMVRNEIKRQMISVAPWTKIFLERDADNVAADLYNILEKVEDKQLRIDITKKIDQLMTNVASEGGSS